MLGGVCGMVWVRCRCTGRAPEEEGVIVKFGEKRRWVFVRAGVGFWKLGRAREIYPGTLPLDRVEVLGSVDGVTTSFQLSQNSRPPCPIIKDKYMMKAQMVKIHTDKNVADLLTKSFDGLFKHFWTNNLMGCQPTKKYDVSFHTKKVFTNMKRISKGFMVRKHHCFQQWWDLYEGSVQPTDTQQTPTIDMPPPKPKKTQKPRHPKRKTTKVPQPTKTKTKATSNESSSQGTSLGDGPRRQDTMGDTSAYTSLEMRFKKLKKKHESRTHKLKRLYKVSLTSKDEGIEDVGEEEVVEVVTTAKMIINDVVNAAKVSTAIADIPISAAKTIVTTAPTVTIESTNINFEDQGKGKVKLIEEPKMPKKKKHQIRADEKLPEKLQDEMQAEIDEEDRLARERAQKKQEENDALINT
uniref:Uncharacterized protein n=1 Tax=Tanacetum cinerariifolium TaxID=118510 RepID=A0A6L2MWK6_TANCI|nr:hypothetical protein [Tanacetum cinerariifolium]